MTEQNQPESRINRGLLMAGLGVMVIGSLQWYRAYAPEMHLHDHVMIGTIGTLFNGGGLALALVSFKNIIRGK
jgi:hypothetical protein